MSIEIKVPPLGESLVDAVVGQWLKDEGDEIARGETILELETDKVNLDVAAEDDGVLGAIQKQEGDTVTVGEVLGVIEASGGNGSSPPPVAEAKDAPAKEAPKAEEASAGTQPASDNAESAPSQATEDSGDGGGRAAPAVRRMAEEHDIDLSQVNGSGAGGRITRDDIVSFLASSQRGEGGAPAQVATPSAASPSSPAAAREPKQDRDDEERIRLSKRRQTIATRLVEAQQTAAMLTTFNEVDMTAVMDLRKRRKDAFKEQHGVNLGFMSFFTKAAIGALKAYPWVNSELQGTELLVKKHYDIGIAVGVAEGLVVPVLKDANRKGFADIESEIVELAGKARDNKLAISDLQGGTFTITNGGVFGSLLSTPILNTPQVGILGMHTIQQRPVARDGEVVIRPMMYIALSYDHRVVDGQGAVQFLVKIKELIEDPETLLLEG
ncbi:MAG: 2-oxoglutarate dehydrogenase complex dihydrolipoyllysine-residue succinyltransferase [Chloroflexia bacterium]|jgi:2-oxoglutarate dehydrogenase E2 component (dihydrolipoamide succinyltransferase)|nr:2-oxoglutarate dehydrogenase complex dihydrolipoyllysine-residue succinyltransferase [Chloroflexia bacterium]